MKKVLHIGLLFYMASLSQASQALRMNGVDHYFESVPTTPSIIEKIKSLKFKNAISERDDEGSGVNLWDIINLAERVWNIVQENRPRVNVQYTYANALPEAVRNGLELEEFSDLQYKTFRQFGKSMFNSTVYDVRYSVVHRYNGTYQGAGRYLENVSVVPLSVNVTWGYNVDLDVKNVSTANVGTRINPVAALTMDMRFAVNSMVKHTEINHSFIFRGDRAEVFILK